MEEKKTLYGGLPVVAISGGFHKLDREKVLGTCGRCGHQWKVVQYRITWAKEGGYKLLCNACDKRASASRHMQMAHHLIDQANAIDARRAAKKHKIDDSK